MFCIYCGAPNPMDASFCSACGKPVTVPPAQPAVSFPEQKQAPKPEKPLESAPAVSAPAVSVSSAAKPAVPIPPKPRSHTLRNVAWIAVVIAAAIIAAIILLSGPSPTDSLEKAGAAFAHQDAQTFDNYVDVQNILGDWTDQAARNWLANNQSSAGDTLIANGLVVGFKTLIVPKIASSVEQELLGNRTSDQPQSNGSDAATNYMAGFLSSGIHGLINSQLTYQGVASQTKSGSDAVLNVRMASPLSNSPLIVGVRMRLEGDHWRIVAIPNVAGLLAQLHPAQ